MGPTVVGWWLGFESFAAAALDIHRRLRYKKMHFRPFLLLCVFVFSNGRWQNNFWGLATGRHRSTSTLLPSNMEPDSWHSALCLWGSARTRPSVWEIAARSVWTRSVKRRNGRKSAPHTTPRARAARARLRGGRMGFFGPATQRAVFVVFDPILHGSCCFSLVSRFSSKVSMSMGSDGPIDTWSAWFGLPFFLLSFGFVWM